MNCEITAVGGDEAKYLDRRGQGKRKTRGCVASIQTYTQTHSHHDAERKKQFTKCCSNKTDNRTQHWIHLHSVLRFHSNNTTNFIFIANKTNFYHYLASVCSLKANHIVLCLLHSCSLDSYHLAVCSLIRSFVRSFAQVYIRVWDAGTNVFDFIGVHIFQPIQTVVFIRQYPNNQQAENHKSSERMRMWVCVLLFSIKSFCFGPFHLQVLGSESLHCDFCIDCVSLSLFIEMLCYAIKGPNIKTQCHFPKCESTEKKKIRFELNLVEIQRNQKRTLECWKMVL